MQYRALGSTGVKVSSLCLGGMTFGLPGEKSFMHGAASSEQQSRSVLDRALQAGINFIDTADVYGPDGLSERILGRWLSSRGVRDDLVIATKGRFRTAEGPNGTGISRMRIQKTIEASLLRLSVERIDLYQIHMQDICTGEDEVMRALEDATRAGKIVYAGCSNYTAYRLMEALWVADKRSFSPFVTLQAQYSLASRDIEAEFVPLCERHGLGILPWSPLAAGLLTGKYRRGETAPEGSRMQSWREHYAKMDTDRNWNVVEAVADVARELGLRESQVALAWLLCRPRVSSVILGARDIQQLDENLVAVDIQLPAWALTKLDEVSSPRLPYPYQMLKEIDGKW